MSLESTWDHQRDLHQRLAVIRLHDVISKLPNQILEKLLRLTRPQYRRPETNHSATPPPETHNHTEAELRMIEFLRAIEVELIQLLNLDTQPIRLHGEEMITQESVAEDVSFMTLISDIGKAGFAENGDDFFASLYIDVNIDDEFKDWILQNLDPLMDTIQHDISQTSVSLSLDAIRKDLLEGHIRPLPLRIFLSIIRYYYSHGPHANPEIVERFQETPETISRLEQIGVDIDRSRIQDYFTKAHIRIGALLLGMVEYTPRQQLLGLITLCHHFTSGEIPLAAISLIKQEPRLMKLVALLEVIDKADGFIHRSHFKDWDTIIDKVSGIVTHNLTALGSTLNGSTELDLEIKKEFTALVEFLGKEQVAVTFQEAIALLKNLDPTKKAILLNTQSNG